MVHKFSSSCCAVVQISCDLHLQRTQNFNPFKSTWIQRLVNWRSSSSHFITKSSSWFRSSKGVSENGKENRLFFQSGESKFRTFLVISTRVSNDLNLPSRSSKGANHVFISRLLLFGLSICANGPSKRSSFRMYVSTSASEPVFPWSYTLHCVHRFNYISY